MNIGMVAKLFGIDPKQLVTEAEKVMKTFSDTMAHFNARIDALEAQLVQQRETLAAMSIALDTALLELARTRDATALSKRPRGHG